MEALEHELESVLLQRIEDVDRRVAGGGEAYAEERAEIRRAAQQALVLRRGLQLGRFLRSLSPATGKPQYLLEFEAQQFADSVVLKVYGRARPGEAVVQLEWGKQGVRTARVLAHGDEPTSWLLMETVIGATLTSDDVAGPALGPVTRELAAVLAPAHVLPVVVTHELPTLGAALERHLLAVVNALVRHGYAVPEGWQELAGQVYSEGRSVNLHGDLFPGNIVRDRGDGLLRIFDTCGYLGDPVFDAARWSARVGGAERASEVLAHWTAVEPGLDHQLGDAMLGVELLMQAGVRELVKDEQGQAADARDGQTLALLRASDALLARRRLLA